MFDIDILCARLPNAGISGPARSVLACVTATSFSLQLPGLAADFGFVQFLTVHST